MAGHLADSDLPWSMVIHHQSMYSTCTRHGSYESLRDSWEPVFDSEKVDFVAAGHNHVYERSVPIAAGTEVAMGEGTVHLVTGGGGASLYDEFEPEWFNAVAQAIEHYVIVDLTASEAAFTAYDLEGGVIDSFVVPVRD